VIGITFRRMEKFERRCSVHGCHVYQRICDVVVGEMLECAREPLNEHDRYSVAVKKDGVIIGRLPFQDFVHCFCIEVDA